MPSASTPSSVRASSAVPRSEPLEVDAAVDHLDLPNRVRDRVLEPLAQPVRDGDDRRGPTHHVGRRGSDARNRPDVRDVLTVRGDHERGTRRERGSEPGRHEEVRVCDVRPEAPRRAAGVSGEGEVPEPAPAAAVDRRALDLVSAREELALEVRDEDPEVRVARARVHLGDEEDPQCATRA